MKKSYSPPKITATVPVPNQRPAPPVTNPVKLRRLAVQAAKEKSEARRLLGLLPLIVGRPQHGRHHPIHGDLVEGQLIHDELIIPDEINFLTPPKS
jgi:hypothetical protein